MRKYAQILDGKVHWIIEDEMTLDELYKHKFCKDQIAFVDITNVAPMPEVGWGYNGTIFTSPVVAVPTLEELLAVIRTKRNRLLAECDWTQLPTARITSEELAAWNTYRNALFDFPETCNPTNPVWPIKPE